jgi:hypothetical protein
MTTHVYVAGPLSGPDVELNVRKALDAGEELRQHGFIVYVPHIMVNWPHTVSYEEWLVHDLAWLTRCDVLLRLPGESPGATREEAFARRLGIPVCHSVAELLAWRAAHVVLDG